MCNGEVPLDKARHEMAKDWIRLTRSTWIKITYRCPKQLARLNLNSIKNSPAY